MTAFTVDPGSHPGDFTTIKVIDYDVVGMDGDPRPFETFTLTLTLTLMLRD